MSRGLVEGVEQEWFAFSSARTRLNLAYVGLCWPPFPSQPRVVRCSWWNITPVFDQRLRLIWRVRRWHGSLPDEDGTLARRSLYIFWVWFCSYGAFGLVLSPDRVESVFFCHVRAGGFPDAGSVACTTIFTTFQ